MSRFFSPDYRKSEGVAAQPSEIDVDYACRGCGYNLRGLVYGGRCPECGLAIMRPGRRMRVCILRDGEPALRRRMITGLRLAALGLGGMIACRLWLLAPIPGRDDLVIVDAISILLSLVWMAGVVLSLPAKIDEYGRVMRYARRAALGAQVCWPIAFAAILLYDMGALNQSQDHLAYLAWIFGRIVGGIGVLVYLWIMATVALDAECEDEARMLTAMAWALLFVSPFTGLLPRGMAPREFGWVFYGFLSIFIVLWGILALLAVFHLARLAGAVATENRIVARSGSRTERIRETRSELDREVESRIRRYPND